MIDLGDKLRLSDNDFDAWLEELGLLHGKRTCEACGGRTTIQNIKRYAGMVTGGAQLKIVDHLISVSSVIKQATTLIHTEHIFLNFCGEK
uniref:Uncharacterized protein n=1 Tax=Meloidogyne incognita TaxID=6306 RepID=A0A914NT42_MELIC